MEATRHPFTNRANMRDRIRYERACAACLANGTTEGRILNRNDYSKRWPGLADAVAQMQRGKHGR